MRIVVNPLKFQIMKITFGAIVTDGRGKLGGHVASKNIGGAFLRTKVTPANPQTTDQQNVRNSFGTNSQAWRGLTESQRLAWNNATIDFPSVKDGASKILSGQMLYNKLNGNLAAAGQALIATPPLPVAIPELLLEGVTADVSDTEIEITASEATVPAGFTMVVEATGPYSPGRFNVKNRFRSLGPAVLVASVVDIYTAWNAKFGTLVAGQKLSVRIKLISNTTGIAGVPSAQSTIIVA